MAILKKVFIWFEMALYDTENFKSNSSTVSEL